MGKDDGLFCLRFWQWKAKRGACWQIGVTNYLIHGLLDEGLVDRGVFATYRNH